MKRDRTQVLLENENVFNETLNEFSTKSYDLASVNEIIKRSGYNKGSFYYRFKDKYEIYLALLDYVFVQQIDVFKSRGFSLISKNNIEEIIYECFNNLVDLYKLDVRFYQIIHHFYNEEVQFINDTLNETVDSLYSRFKNKIKHLDGYNDVVGYMIDAIYVNFPIEKVNSDPHFLNHIVDGLFNKNIETSTNHTVHPFIKDLEELSQEKFNVILTDFNDYMINDQWFDIFSFALTDKEVIKRIKKISGQWKFDLEKLLLKYIKKPIFNGLAIQSFLNSDSLEKIESDSLLYSIFINLLYAVIDLKKYILLRNFDLNLTTDQKDTLFDVILPIIGDLSRIVIIDKSYDLDSLDDVYIHYYDKLNGFKSQHIDEIKGFSDKEIICEYVKGDRYYHKTFSSIKDFNAFINDNLEILSINTVYKLTIDLYRKLYL